MYLLLYWCLEKDQKCFSLATDKAKTMERILAYMLLELVKDLYFVYVCFCLFPYGMIVIMIGKCLYEEIYLINFIYMYDNLITFQRMVTVVLFM